MLQFLCSFTHQRVHLCNVQTWQQSKPTYKQTFRTAHPQPYKPIGVHSTIPCSSSGPHSTPLSPSRGHLSPHPLLPTPMGMQHLPALDLGGGSTPDKALQLIPTPMSHSPPPHSSVSFSQGLKLRDGLGMPLTADRCEQSCR